MTDKTKTESNQESAVEKAIAKILTIATSTGHVYTPACVTEKPTKVTRGVQVTAGPAKKFTVKINAVGTCLKSLKTSITDVLGDAVVFDGDEKQANESSNDSTKGTGNATS